MALSGSRFGAIRLPRLPVRYGDRAIQLFLFGAFRLPRAVRARSVSDMSAGDLRGLSDSVEWCRFITCWRPTEDYQWHE